MDMFDKQPSVQSNGMTHLDALVPDWMREPLSTGTSIMAVEYGSGGADETGVVIGADSRTTTGAYIANRVTDKLTKITDKIYCCRSGSAADTQCIADIVSYHLNFYESETGVPAQVKTAANLFREMCYNYRDQLTAGIICAGWDKQEGGQVFTIPLGGMLLRQPISIGGSGSTYVYGHVDANFKLKMSKEECVTFVKKTLALAMSRDGSSGGVIRIGILNKDGIERRVFTGKEVPKFYEG